MTEERMIQRDRMRYTKNKLSANLAIAAIVFDVLYFVKVYQADVGNYYYNILIGVSIVYNLVFLLAAFLCSEGVKNYGRSYSYVLIVLGIVQIVRIFILPARAYKAVIESSGQQIQVMTGGVFAWLTVCLVCSGICLVASAVVNLAKCNALAEHMKALEESGAPV